MNARQLTAEPEESELDAEIITLFRKLHASGKMEKALSELVSPSSTLDENITTRFKYIAIERDRVVFISQLESARGNIAEAIKILFDRLANEDKRSLLRELQKTTE